MCILFISTSHPKYSLVLVDNRDEFVLRPTSRPHWWKHPKTGQDILSSRDLQRPERGTWMGISRQGLIAILTNYRELEANEDIKGRRSRGGMVVTWLGEPAEESVKQSTKRLVEGGEGVTGVGGFSMVCGKLKRKSEGFAVVSNRAAGLDQVPIVSPDQAQGWGLTNTTFETTEDWPKLSEGIPRFDSIIRENSMKGDGATEDEFINRLFSHLDTNTMHGAENEDLYETMESRKGSIFVPLHGDKKQHDEMAEARAKGPGNWPTDEELKRDYPPVDEEKGGTGNSQGFMYGLYGTQRQTVILVDRDGNVSFVERALFDPNGNEIPRGEGDVKFHFKIDGWEG